jgi:hypothetical protein
MAEVEVEDWSLFDEETLDEETTGARSSMHETSNGKIVAQIHYASRLPRVMALQGYLR